MAPLQLRVSWKRLERHGPLKRRKPSPTAVSQLMSDRAFTFELAKFLISEVVLTGDQKSLLREKVSRSRSSAPESLSDESRPLSEDRAIGPYKKAKSLPNESSRTW